MLLNAIFLNQICRKLTHNENNAQSRVVGKLSFLHRKIDNFRNWFFSEIKILNKNQSICIFHNQLKIYTFDIESNLNVIGGM